MSIAYFSRVISLLSSFSLAFHSPSTMQLIIPKEEGNKWKISLTFRSTQFNWELWHFRWNFCQTNDLVWLIRQFFVLQSIEPGTFFERMCYFESFPGEWRCIDGIESGSGIEFPSNRLINRFSKTNWRESNASIVLFSGLSIENKNFSTEFSRWTKSKKTKKNSIQAFFNPHQSIIENKRFAIIPNHDNFHSHIVRT